MRRGWAYYAGGTVVFALAAGLSVAGMRGGMTRMTRPITLSNAMLYTADSGKANLILSNPFCILRTIGNAGSVKYRKYFTEFEKKKRYLLYYGIYVVSTVMQVATFYLLLNNA